MFIFVLRFVISLHKNYIHRYHTIKWIWYVGIFFGTHACTWWHIREHAKVFTCAPVSLKDQVLTCALTRLILPEALAMTLYMCLIVQMLTCSREDELFWMWHSCELVIQTNMQYENFLSCLFSTYFKNTSQRRRDKSNHVGTFTSLRKNALTN